jgi:protein SCO1/2
MRTSSRVLRACLAALAMCLALAARGHGVASADVDTRSGSITSVEPAASPAMLAFEPHVGTSLPDATFIDEEGRPVRLRTLATGRPALLVLGYYTCRDLCSVTLDSVRKALARDGLVAGGDLDVIVASIDPADTPATARERRDAVLGGARAGWHFLSGNDASIAQLAQAVGFRYERTHEGFAHPAGVLIIDAHGRIARYLADVSFAPMTIARAVRAAPADAASDPASTPSRWLGCFHYDPHTGRYTPVALGLVRVAGAAGALALVLSWVLARRRRGEPRR